MKLGIMQPYFFPYLGYFDLIRRTDRWVVFDVVKYVPKSWMNRNRILHPSDGWQYVTVPVNKHHENGAIKDVVVIDKGAAHRRIMGQIQHYRTSRAPYFTPVKNLIDRCFADCETNLLRDLNVESLAVVCDYLDVPFAPEILSKSSMKLPPIEHPGQWALEISSVLGASVYINPPGGREIFIPQEFEERGIGLEFTDLLDYQYRCGGYIFVERLSILDVLMWNSPTEIKGYLESGSLA